MAKHLILVAGNIGAGKTALTERIGARLGWWTGFESVADNPYLSDFYGDMHAWSFHLQIFFLGHRADQYLEAARDSRSAILDRSIYEDAHIFARALHHMGNLGERDYLAYRRLFDVVVNGLPRPDLLILPQSACNGLAEPVFPTSVPDLVRIRPQSPRSTLLAADFGCFEDQFSTYFRYGLHQFRDFCPIDASTGQVHYTGKKQSRLRL